MATQYYYQYIGNATSPTIATDANVNISTSHTVTFPHNVVIDGSLRVEDQTTHHNLDVGATTADQLVLHNHLTVTDTEITHTRPIVVQQQGVTVNDGIQIAESGTQWNMFKDSANDLVFAYGSTTVYKISHN